MSVLSLPTSTQNRTPFLRPWRELTLLALMGMDMCWIATWYVDFTHIGQPIPFLRAYVVLGVMLLIAHYLGRLLNDLNIKTALRRGIFALVILVNLWVGLQLLLYYPAVLSPVDTIHRNFQAFAELNIIPAEFWVMLAILLITSRGVRLARQTLGIDRVIASFQLGVLMFFAYAAFLPLLPVKTVLGIVMAFLLLGLIGMSTGRIYEAGRARGARLVRVNLSWLLSILVISLIVVAFGIVPAMLLPENVSYSVASYFVMAMGIIVALFLLLGAPFVVAILFVVSRLAPYWHKLTFPTGLQDLANFLRSLNVPSSVDNLAERIALAKPITLWGIIIVVGLVLLAGLSWRMWSERSLDLEQGESLLDGQDLLDRLRRRFRKGMQQVGKGLHRVRLSPAEQLLAAARVRWIYSRLMNLCSDLDKPRHPAMTPLEFLPALQQIFPELAVEVQEITQAYVRVRYGQAIETNEELAVLTSDWQRVEQQGNQLRKKHK